MTLTQLDTQIPRKTSDRFLRSIKDQKRRVVSCVFPKTERLDAGVLENLSRQEAAGVCRLLVDHLADGIRDHLPSAGGRRPRRSGPFCGSIVPIV